MPCVSSWSLPKGPRRIGSRRLGLVTAVAAICECSQPGTDSVPYATTFSTVGDTVIASTTGDVPEGHLRHLVVDWRVRTDSAPAIIGDVNVRLMSMSREATMPGACCETQTTSLRLSGSGSTRVCSPAA
jgi:hypothetical protein